MNSPAMQSAIFPPHKERIASRCVCCGSTTLHKSPAVLMPFVAHRTFGWAPVEITEDWGLKTLRPGMAYTVCNSIQCGRCSHLFLDLRFDDAEMGALYKGYREAEYTALREHYEPGYAARNATLVAGVPFLPEIEAFLAPHLRHPPRVLDWGGDTGENTPFKHANALLHIYDISAKDTPLVPGARQVGRDEAMAQQYDLVVCSNVLEHVPYPSELIHDMRQAMRPDTVLYIEVPHEGLVRNAGAAAPAGLQLQKKHWHEHINFYTEASMRTLLENCGLAIIGLQFLHKADGENQYYVFQIACKLA